MRRGPHAVNGFYGLLVVGRVRKQITLLCSEYMGLRVLVLVLSFRVQLGGQELDVYTLACSIERMLRSVCALRDDALSITADSSVYSRRNLLHGRQSGLFAGR